MQRHERHDDDDMCVDTIMLPSHTFTFSVIINCRCGPADGWFKEFELNSRISLRFIALQGGHTKNKHRTTFLLITLTETHLPPNIFSIATRQACDLQLDLLYSASAASKAKSDGMLSLLIIGVRAFAYPGRRQAIIIQHPVIDLSCQRSALTDGSV
jgi:hypothetical protein